MINIIFHTDKYQYKIFHLVRTWTKIRIMNLLNPVSTIMQTELITLQKNDTIAKAASIFQEYKIHHILIVDGQSLVGIVSKSDFLFFQRGFAETSKDKLVEEIRMNHFDVASIMTTGIATLSSEDKINVALEIFKENLFHAILIVDNDALVGIVTTYDILCRVGEDKEVINSYESISG